ncbi:hypothetical protein EJ05DRAFT_445496 [Pseudovirgaria hyperparasitica]|uniref:Zn(2)-C6 fungal-type domain-containing protein n=1 Tax=Pseudovirgaria hyperparasitica TaxID=470096 RepID=A0A6A6VV65_9PEZI|nr:uncharacterized protein EJ05DRAFT_445496 [Pseudovirgaria hyperparasitica]KAF2753141.1 hypothetical protein EJ05DRAFT_445496 [Pseudovirgaria hyperparasitica]
MSVSCELCKQRKVKCDRGQPSCGWCVKNTQVCEYKERKKPGLRAGYGRELEARLDRLEDLIHQQQTTISQLSNHVVNNAQSSPLSHDGPLFRSPSILQTHIPRPETALFLQKPSTFAPNHSMINEYARHQPQHNGYQQQQHIQHEPSNGLPTPARDVYSHTNPPLESPSLNLANAPPSAPVMHEGDFPPYDLLYALADLYFKHINTWCPILHRRSTLDSLFGASSSSLDDGDRILLHAIVATTLRFSTDARLTQGARDRYHELSKQKVLLYGLENSSVKALQAMVILALDLVGFSNGPPGWNLLALITRAVVQLGLAVETTSSMVSPQFPSIYTLRAMVLPEPKDWIEEESRRRLFWMIYLLDRYATAATAFEFALDEREIDRKLPCRDDIFNRNQPVDTRWFRTIERTDYSMEKPENMGSFSYYIEVIGLLSRIHQFLKKPVDIGSLSDVEKWQAEYRELDKALAEWKHSLPHEYGNVARIFNGAGNKIVNTGWIMLHAAYNTTIIRLHSSAAYPTTRSPIFTPSYSASQRCLSAVENITALVNYLKSTTLLSTLGPPFAFSLWVAARVLLVHGSTISQNVNPSIHALVETLNYLGQYWRVAERYATLLTRVLEEYSDSQRAPPTAEGERPTPSTVRILADMRRCAYDLDFLISRQPRASGASGGMSRLPSVTPARTPQPQEFEYLDVFDFFNVPRLPVSMEGGMMVGQQGASAGPESGLLPDAGAVGGNGGNEFNITNFSFDADSDWFMKAGA